MVGRREEKRSLGTRDPEEAKRLQAIFLADIDDKWARLRARRSDHAEERAKVLSEREAHEHARWMEHHWYLKHRDNPSQQQFWRTDLFDRLWTRKTLLDFIRNPDAAVFDETDAKRRERPRQPTACN